MLEILDYSARRGVVALMLDKIYSALDENASCEKLSNAKPPGNKILWKQSYKKILLETERRWLFAMEGDKIAGFVFYRLGVGGRVYLNEFLLSPDYTSDRAVFSALLDKFFYDPSVKNCAGIFAGENVRIEHDKELLASVGFRDEYEDGFQSLGGPADAAGALKIRYGFA